MTDTHSRWILSKAKFRFSFQAFSSAERRIISDGECNFFGGQLYHEEKGQTAEAQDQ